MSLINQMLNDLESRQAYLYEKSSSALDGVNCTDLYDEDSVVYRTRWLFIIFLVVLISAILYVFSNPSSMNIFNIETVSKFVTEISGTEVSSTSSNENFRSRITPIVEDTGIINSLNTGVISSPEKIKDKPDDVVSSRASDTGALSGNDSGGVINQPGVSESKPDTSVEMTATSGGFTLFNMDHAIDAPDTQKINETDPEQIRDEITSLSVLTTDNGIAIDLQFSADPQYSLYTLENPSRLVLELRDFDPSDSVDLQDTGSDGVTLRTASKDDNYQLIFEFSSPVSLQDTNIMELDSGTTLHIDLWNQIPAVVIEEPDNAEIVEDISPETEHMPVPEPVFVVDRPKLNKKVHKVDRVRQSDDLYQEGMAAYRNGDISVAMDKLYAAVSSHSHNYVARVALVELLLQQGDIQRVRELLADGLDIKPDHSKMAKLMAQILAEEQNNRMALFYLERALPDIHKDPEYHALAAALLQREDRHREAIAFYRKVLVVKSDNGIWWMGLGISLEASGESHLALSAYRRARQDSNLSTSVANYLDDRISQLYQRQAS